MTFLWHHWAILGVALIASELLIPAFVLIWFGFGALIVAVMLAIAPSTGLTAQLLVWTISSVAFVASWFKIFKPHLHKTTAGRSLGDAIGDVGLLTRDVAPFQKGQVRFQTPLFGADVWDCIADEDIKAGERVKVIGVEGSIVKITHAK
ncbi:MAG: NfeD family protein [Alphaproteobacteria bacterium]|nr:NfeD family protein [Alphaproteobacteria bacterium]